MTAPKGKTSQRGYGWQHQKARKAALAAFKPNQPCARCGESIIRASHAELDHDDDDRTKYIGLSHSWCNREYGGYKSHGTAPKRQPQTTPFGHWDSQGRWCVTSRDW